MKRIPFEDPFEDAVFMMLGQGGMVVDYGVVKTPYGHVEIDSDGEVYEVDNPTNEEQMERAHEAFEERLAICMAQPDVDYDDAYAQAAAAAKAIWAEYRAADRDLPGNHRYRERQNDDGDL